MAHGQPHTLKEIMNLYLKAFPMFMAQGSDGFGCIGSDTWPKIYVHSGDWKAPWNSSSLIFPIDGIIP